ncbi:MAG: hypothetical protein ACI9EV_000666 [Urechidicola sp.]|jgi:hypothetical protein
MKKIIILLIAVTTFASADVMAGNEDRTGAAGATQLLFNPWVRSTGLMGSNIATVKGIEGSFMNVAGLAFTRKTEIAITNTTYMRGSDVSVYGLGLGLRLGESSTFGLTYSFVDYGDFRKATTEVPEGDGSLFNVNASNITLSYAKEFSNSIYGGISVKLISESIFNVKSNAVAFDAGIQYISGENDQIKIGINLKNVGPTMDYSGDGLSVQALIQDGDNNDYLTTLDQRSDEYELPSLISMGIGYDFLLDENNTLTLSGSFTSNSFTNDQYRFGVEFKLKDFFILRGGYLYEQDITDGALSANVLTGLGAGLSIQAPIGTEGGTIGFDYSYQDTNPFDGNHRVGIRIDI